MSTDVITDATPAISHPVRRTIPPLTKADAVRIGLMPENARMRIWGRLAKKHGFGRGMPYQFANTLYLALLEEERVRMTWPINLTPQDDDAAQSAWKAQLRTIREHLSTRIDDEFDPIEYEVKDGKRKKRNARPGSSSSCMMLFRNGLFPIYGLSGS